MGIPYMTYMNPAQIPTIILPHLPPGPRIWNNRVNNPDILEALAESRLTAASRGRRMKALVA